MTEGKRLKEKGLGRRKSLKASLKSNAGTLFKSGEENCHEARKHLNLNFRRECQRKNRRTS